MDTHDYNMYRVALIGDEKYAILVRHRTIDAMGRCVRLDDAYPPVTFRIFS